MVIEDRLFQGRGVELVAPPVAHQALGKAVGLGRVVQRVLIRPHIDQAIDRIVARLGHEQAEAGDGGQDRQAGRIADIGRRPGAQAPRQGGVEPPRHEEDERAQHAHDHAQGQLVAIAPVPDQVADAGAHLRGRGLRPHAVAHHHPRRHRRAGDVGVDQGVC